MAALTTVARCKDLIVLGRSVTTDVGTIQFLVDAVSKWILNEINRDIFLTQYDETLRGTGTGVVVLTNYPVVSVSSVDVGFPNRRSPLVVDVDYVLTGQAIELLGGKFPNGPARVRVVYAAGYADVPLDLDLACAKLVSLKYRQLERIGQQSKTLLGETITFDLDSMPKDVVDVLGNYRRVIQQGSAR